MKDKQRIQPQQEIVLPRERALARTFVELDCNLDEPIYSLVDRERVLSMREILHLTNLTMCDCDDNEDIQGARAKREGLARCDSYRFLKFLEFTKYGKKFRSPKEYSETQYFFAEEITLEDKERLTRILKEEYKRKEEVLIRGFIEGRPAKNVDFITRDWQRYFREEYQHALIGLLYKLEHPSSTSSPTVLTRTNQIKRLDVYGKKVLLGRQMARSLYAQGKIK